MGLAAERVQCFSKENFQKDGMLRDNIDGIQYYSSIEKLSSTVPANVRVITFTVNTDGIGFYESSKKSIWPYLLAINELDKGCRLFGQQISLNGSTINELGMIVISSGARSYAVTMDTCAT